MERDEDLRALWQTQLTKAETIMSLEDVMTKDGKLDLRVRIRNASEYLASALVVFVFTKMAFAPEAGFWATRAGCALVDAGMIYMVVRLYRNGAASRPPEPTRPANEIVAHYRASLVKQRDLLASVWRWYLGPLVPGLVVLMVGVAFDAPYPPAVTWVHRALIAAVGLIWVAIVFAAVAWVNKRGARKLDAQIDALGA